jgi:hypothetical protein
VAVGVGSVVPAAARDGAIGSVGRLLLILSTSLFFTVGVEASGSIGDVAVDVGTVGAVAACIGATAFCRSVGC